MPSFRTIFFQTLLFLQDIIIIIIKFIPYVILYFWNHKTR